jgi:hypothetical protein
MLPKHLHVDRYWTQTDAWRPCRGEVKTARLRERREAFRVEDANADSTPIAAFEDCSHEDRCPYCGGA